MGFGNGGLSAQGLFQGAMTGLAQGALSLGLNFATEELGANPLLMNLGYAVAGGILEGTVNDLFGTEIQQGRTLLENVFDVYSRNVLSAFNGGTDPWSQAVYISQILDFTDIIQRDGLVEALNTYATGMLNSMVVNSMIQSAGTVGDYLIQKLNSGDFSRENVNGKEVIVVYVENTEGDTIGKTFFDELLEEQYDFLGYEDLLNEFFGYGDVGVDVYGDMGYKEGFIRQRLNDGYVEQDIINDNAEGPVQSYVRYWNANGRSVVFKPENGDAYIGYDDQGLLADYILTNDELSYEAYYADKMLNGYNWNNITEEYYNVLPEWALEALGEQYDLQEQIRAGHIENLDLLTDDLFAPAEAQFIQNLMHQYDGLSIVPNWEIVTSSVALVDVVDENLKMRSITEKKNGIRVNTPDYYGYKSTITVNPFSGIEADLSKKWSFSLQDWTFSGIGDAGLSSDGLSISGGVEVTYQKQQLESGISLMWGAVHDDRIGDAWQIIVTFDSSTTPLPGLPMNNSNFDKTSLDFRIGKGNRKEEVKENVYQQIENLDFTPYIHTLPHTVPMLVVGIYDHLETGNFNGSIQNVISEIVRNELEE